MQNKIRSIVLAIPRLTKRLIVIIVDCIIAIIAVWLAFLSKVRNIHPSFRESKRTLYPACLYIINDYFFTNFFIFFQLYNEIFSFFWIKNNCHSHKASLYTALYSTIFTVISVDGVPRTIGIIQPILFLLLIICFTFFALFGWANKD